MKTDKKSNITYTYDLTDLSPEEMELLHRSVWRSLVDVSGEQQHRRGVPIKGSAIKPMFSETDKAILRIMRDHICKIMPELDPEQEEDEEEF